MILGQKAIGISQAITADGVLQSSVSIQKSEQLILVLQVENRIDGTYTLELEHSPDGVSFKSLGSLTPLSANGMEILNITVPTFHIFRFKLTSASVTSGATVKAFVVHS